MENETYLNEFTLKRISAAEHIIRGHLRTIEILVSSIEWMKKSNFCTKKISDLIDREFKAVGLKVKMVDGNKPIPIFNKPTQTTIHPAFKDWNPLIK
jgi:hypothetical protein